MGTDPEPVASQFIVPHSRRIRRPGGVSRANVKVRGRDSKRGKQMCRALRTGLVWVSYGQIRTVPEVIFTESDHFLARCSQRQ